MTRAAELYEVVTFRGVQIIAVPMSEAPKHTPCIGCIYEGDCPDNAHKDDGIPNCVPNGLIWKHFTEGLKIEAITAKLTRTK